MLLHKYRLVPCIYILIDSKVTNVSIINECVYIYI